MQFTAVDVETANADMASVCQIGIARFVAGKIFEEWKTYVDPEDFFDDINVSIHGINEQIVAGAPTFREAADQINAFLDGEVVVTHTHTLTECLFTKLPANAVFLYQIALGSIRRELHAALGPSLPIVDTVSQASALVLAIHSSIMTRSRMQRQ